jgi:hypothetical protein
MTDARAVLRSILQALLSNIGGAGARACALA